MLYRKVLVSNMILSENRVFYKNVVFFLLCAYLSVIVLLVPILYRSVLSLEVIMLDVKFGALYNGATFIGGCRAKVGTL